MQRILATEQIKQCTDEWYRARHDMLTASDVATVLGENPYNVLNDIAKKKCAPKCEMIDNKYTRHGTLFEPVACEIFKKYKGERVYEVGLLRHPRYKYIGASPDGVINDLFLIEIKCPYNRQIKDGYIPKMYWIQMQIQMEVANIDNCYFMECKFEKIDLKDASNYIEHGTIQDGDEEYYWGLKRYQILAIERDREWFNRIIGKLEEFWNDILIFRTKGFRKRPREEILTRAQQKRHRSYFVNFREWIGANHMYNYVNNEPLLDWFALNGDKLGYKRDQSKFMVFTKDKTTEFSRRVIDKICENIPNTIVISKEFQIPNWELIEKTQEAILKHVPVICGGFFVNEEAELYGRVDLLIRSDYITRLFPNTDHVSEDSKYFIVQMDYATIELRSNEFTIGRNKSCRQIATRFVFLKKLMDNQCHNDGYLLAKRFSQRRSNIKTFVNSSFSRLAKIIIDEDDINLVRESVQWLKDVKNIEEYDSNNRNLRPNMSNPHDFPWHSAKKKIAYEVDEISLIWNCSYNERNNALDHGITSYKDLRCTAAILDPRNNQGLVQDILTANQQELKEPVLKYNDVWCDVPDVDIYIDFETINNLSDNFTEFPIVPQNTMEIFMIGIGWVIEGKWKSKVFTTKRLTLQEERRIMREFFLKLIDLKNIGSYKIYHWSNAEIKFLTRAMSRHLDLEYEAPFHNWIDLLKVFKEQPIVCNGLLNFKLKEVVKVFNQYRWIDTNYTDLKCTDGMNAMVTTIEFDCLAELENKELLDYPQMKDIERYNDKDCFVMWKILKYIRSRVV
jgi:putative phage-type endonuclease